MLVAPADLSSTLLVGGTTAHVCRLLPRARLQDQAAADAHSPLRGEVCSPLTHPLPLPQPPPLPLPTTPPPHPPTPYHPPPPHPPTPRTTTLTLSVNRFVRYSSLALVASRSAPGFVKLLSGGALERWTRALVAQAAYLAPVDQMNRTLAQSASPPLLAPQLTPPHPLEAVGRDSRDSLLFPAA